MRVVKCDHRVPWAHPVGRLPEQHRITPNLKVRIVELRLVTAVVQRVRMQPMLIIRTLDPKFRNANFGWNRYPMLAEINGHRMQLQTGDNQIPLPPGRWHLFVYCSYYGMKIGKAEMTFDLYPGPPMLVHYAAPHTIYSAGVLSYEPVERPGKHVTLLIYTLAISIPILIFFVALAAKALTG